MVEWKKLGDLCSKITDGSHYSPKSVEEGYFMPSVKDMTTNGFDYTLCKKISEDDYLSLIKSGCKPKINDVLVAKDGSMLKYVFPISKEENIVVLSSIAILTPKTNIINSRYLSYYLLKSDVKKQTIREYSSKGGVPRIILKNFRKIGIPVPSLHEQIRIIDILDTFTASIENLKEQIAQRRKQYEYYRDQFLDLEGKEGVEMKYITDVAKSFTGLTYKPENVSGSGTLVLRSSNINEDVLSFDDNVFVQMVIPERAKVQENDILICVRNGSKRLVGKSAMITKEAEGMAFGAFMTILRSFAINSKFLFYVWQSEKVRKQYKGDEAMPIAQITAKDFQRIVIPLPSRQEQRRIVTILDTFEASIRNLEAQQMQRQKQYEYYREKLLTFE